LMHLRPPLRRMSGRREFPRRRRSARWHRRSPSSKTRSSQRASPADDSIGDGIRRSAIRRSSSPFWELSRWSSRYWSFCDRRRRRRLLFQLRRRRH